VHTQTLQKLRKRKCTALYAEWYLSQFLHYNAVCTTIFLHCAVHCVHCTVQHCIVLYRTLQCTVQCSLHCTVQRLCIALQCTLSMRINAVQCSVQCSVVQCSVLCSAVHCSVSARLPDHTHITRIHTLTFKETGCQPVPAPVDPPTPPEAFCTLARRRTRTHTHSLTT
jgi:hypothetical protein